MRIGMWQRLGIVFSVLWFLGAGLRIFNVEDNKARAIAALSAELCRDRQARGRDLSENCSEAFSDDIRAVGSGPITEAAIVAITPIPTAWLLAFVVVWTTRWVWRGRST